MFTGIDEISEDVYKDVDHSDTEDSEKSDSSDSEFLSDEEHKPKSSAQNKDKAERKRPKASTEGENKEGITGAADKVTAEPPLKDIKDKQSSSGTDRDPQDKTKTPSPLDKPKTSEEGRAASSVVEHDSDSERELVIDLGEDHGSRDSKRTRRDPGTAKKETTMKTEG